MYDITQEASEVQHATCNSNEGKLGGRRLSLLGTYFDDDNSTDDGDDDVQIDE